MDIFSSTDRNFIDGQLTFNKTKMTICVKRQLLFRFSFLSIEWERYIGHLLTIATLSQKNPNHAYINL